MKALQRFLRSDPTRAIAGEQSWESLLGQSAGLVIGKRKPCSPPPVLPRVEQVNSAGFHSELTYLPPSTHCLFFTCLLSSGARGIEVNSGNPMFSNTCENDFLTRNLAMSTAGLDRPMQDCVTSWASASS